MKYLLETIFTLLLLQRIGEALRIVNLVIPSRVSKGETVSLQCQVDLGVDQLYSLTWWKDDKPFFRYTPTTEKKKITYQVSGIRVDVYNSTMETVVLNNVSIKSSGVYKCELVAEHPSFEKDSHQQNMTVIYRPESNPIMSASESHFSLGDLLIANCTSPRARPPPNIRWLINDLQVPDRYGEIISSELPYTNLISRTSQLRLRLRKNHFHKGHLILSCAAYMDGFYNQISHLQLQTTFGRPTHMYFGAASSLDCYSCFLSFLWNVVISTLTGILLKPF